MGIKHLVKRGNSLALVIDRGVLDLLELDATTPLRLSTDGRRLVITPVRNPDAERKLRHTVEDGNQRLERILGGLVE